MAKTILIAIIALLLSFAITARITGTIGTLDNIELHGLLGFGTKKAQVYVFKIVPSAPAQSPRYTYKINQTARLKDQRKKEVRGKIDKIREGLRQEQQRTKTRKEKIIQLKKNLIAQVQKETKVDNFDFYMGVGSYGSDAYDLAGDYIWAKIRCRPFHFYDDKLELGFFGFGSFGIGSIKNACHTASKFAIGPTLKMNFSHWATDLDFGIGKLSNEIGAGKQIDNVFILSGIFDFYGRRDQNKKWLAKTSFGFEANLPYSTSYKNCSRKYNNKVVSVWFKQAIYDFKPTQNLILSPEFNLGLKREYEAGANFLRIGPSLAMSYHGQNILSLSFLNYETRLGGGESNIHWLSGWISIGGLVKSIKASRIKEATSEDLAKRIE